MWWIIIFSILGIFLLLYLIIFLTGNWRATLNRVITQYVAWKQMEPKYSDKEIFFEILDSRYQKPSKDVAGLMFRMYQEKEEIKKNLEMLIKNETDEINIYGLPFLIYVCLLIEGNNYLNPNKSFKQNFDPIVQEVKRQGFEKYC